MAMSNTLKFVLVAGITLGLLVPGLVMLPRDRNAPYVPPTTPPFTQPPLDNQDEWESYTGGATSLGAINQSLFTKNVTLDELKVLAGQEAEKVLNGTAGNGTSAYDDRNTAEPAAPGSKELSGSGGAARVVEEADIVKLQGPFLYVLNQYQGLIVVDVSSPDDSKVTGSARVLGYPQEMYVVGNLAFIIVSTDYGFWYGYYTRPLEADSMIDTGGKNIPIGTQIVVVNLVNKYAPRIVMSIPLPGFASDSRRVGDVVYAVTNTWSWSEYGTGNGGTYVTSVDFSTPSKVRRVDTLFFNGTSNQVHASTTALYVAQPDGNRWEREGYFTDITYVDISDPHGAIRKRDTFSVGGQVNDKYMLDQYGSTFRVVSHFWGWGGVLGSSNLTVFDISHPDAIVKLGQLAIDDAGTLMATRFAGTRAYTIHLPRSVDPLDVIDLSDPSHPRLTDVLEMPGWVTHIEVRGYKLIALGVDDTDGRKVAVSLFDVTNAREAKLKARVSLGEGYSWSEANWEPKALTIVDEQRLVLVPYSTYSNSETGGYTSTEGVQLVEFDLDKCTLKARGFIPNTEPVRRTRSYSWSIQTMDVPPSVIKTYYRILATSDYALQVINAENRDSPKVTKKIQFVWSVHDAIRMGGNEVQLVGTDWDSKQELRCAPAGSSAWAAPLSEIPLNLTQASFYPDGNVLFAVGVEGLELKVIGYDFSNPGKPVLTGAVSTPLPASGGGIEKRGGTAYYYGSLRPVMLDGKLLAVLATDYYGNNDNATLHLFDLSSGRPAALPSFGFQPGPAPAKPEQYYYSYINQIMGVGRMLYFTGWASSGSYLGRIDLSQPSTPVMLDYTAVKGTIVGAESDGSAVYTTTYYWDAGQAGTFNKYSLSAQGANVSWSVSFNMSVTSAIIRDGQAYLTLYKYPMWYYIDYYPGAGERSVQPSTTLCVLDLKGASPVATGALQLDGYASAAMLHGSKLIVTGNSMLAAYDISTGAPRFAGAAAIRGSFESMRAFDGGVLVSEGYYGTETVTF